MSHFITDTDLQYFRATPRARAAMDEPPRYVTCDEAAHIFRTINKRCQPAVCASSQLYANGLARDRDVAALVVMELVHMGVSERDAVALWDTKANTSTVVNAIVRDLQPSVVERITKIVEEGSRKVFVT